MTLQKNFHKPPISLWAIIIPAMILFLCSSCGSSTAVKSHKNTNAAGETTTVKEEPLPTAPSSLSGDGVDLKLHSDAFQEGQAIPPQFTGDGEDISPSLSWNRGPDQVKSFALICDDPDAPAGTWVHWVLFNIPADMTSLPQNLPTTEKVLDGAFQGINDFKTVGYKGPAPPPGKTHRYFFKLYGLDTKLTLKPGITKQELEKAMEDHIVAQGQLIGTYRR